MIERCDKIVERVKEIGVLLNDPSVFQDFERSKELGKELKNLEPVAEMYEKYLKIENDLNDAKAMLEIETDETMKEFFKQEIENAKASLEKLDYDLKVLMLPKDENDEKNVIMEIRGGAGGDEASLFAGEILRMYLRFAEINRWKVEIIDQNETELGGIKECTLMIKGKGAYSKLKYESGVHRVQRVPVTETQGRVHTSTITVAVLPEQEDVEIEVNENDLRIDTYRASGAGGQHVNKTSSAVRLIHVPTGIVAECQTQRSQVQNREYAMNLLKSRLYEIEKNKQDSEIANARKSQVGSGDRSEKIRTYNYPQGRITDHRIGMSVYQFENFLNGDLDEMIDNLIAADNAEKLKGEEE